MTTCDGCAGTGDCTNCNGYDSSTCDQCLGTGECPECDGTGAPEFDDRDYCQSCNGTVDTCVCSDLVTPHPSEL